MRKVPGAVWRCTWALVGGVLPVDRVDAFTVRYTGKHFWQAFHHATYGKPDLPMPE